METPLKFFLVAAVILFIGCKSTTGPLIVKDTTNEIEKNNTLFVFVGEKISVSPIPFRPGDFDNGVKAKYKILQAVYGNYNRNVIDFNAYDHYGIPEFTKYKTVLLFVSEEEGKFYQEKYMFDPVFKTKDGRWAGPYSNEYGHSYNKHTTIKPQKIDFVEEVSFPTKGRDDNGTEFTLTYPEPYFKTVGDKAFVIYGNYIEELFKLKRDGVLTARELFAGKKEKEIEWEQSRDTTTDDF